MSSIYEHVKNGTELSQSDIRSMDNISAIYMLINRINGKIYIGRTKRLKRRMKEHFAKDFQKYNGQKLVNAKNKYGVDAFAIKILTVCEHHELVEMEDHYLSLYQPFGENGYNIRKHADADNSFVMTDEQKSKISNSVKKYYENRENPFKNKKHSEESKNKIKQNIWNEDGTLKNGCHTESHRNKMREISKKNKNGEILVEWIKTNGHPRNTKVGMFSKDGKLLKQFESIAMAGEHFNKKKATAISNCLNGRTKTAYGFLWSYL